MYVIFPLDELLDLHSARENKRGRPALIQHQGHTGQSEVLPLSFPNQLTPGQVKPYPPNKQLPNTTNTPLQKPPNPTPPAPASASPPPPPPPSSVKQQQKAPPTPPQKPPLTPSRKPSLSKAPSKTSVTVTPPSISVAPQSPSQPVSVTNASQNANVKKTLQQQQQQQQQQTVASTTPAAQIPPDQGNKRQRSSHSTSTETSSTSSSTGAKGKALLSPQASGGAPVANRSSWGGGPILGPFQESCPARSGSFKAFKDITVTTEGTSVKIVVPSRSESVQDITGSTLSVRPPVKKNNSFRSHLSDRCALLPRHTGVEPIKKAPVPGASPLKQQPSSSSSETLKKTLEPLEATPPSPGSKTPETAVTGSRTPVQSPKDTPAAGGEEVKIKQEVPVRATPPPPAPPAQQQQLTAAESLRIQQDCLSQGSESKGTAPGQRHPSGGRSNRSSGSQKLSDHTLSGVTTRGSTTTGGGSSSSSSHKTPGGLGSPPRGLQQQQLQRNAVMANEPSFRDLTDSSHNESLKAHNAFTFKLVKTGTKPRLPAT